MNSEQWESSTDPQSMLASLLAVPHGHVSERKLRLFAAALWRAYLATREAARYDCGPGESLEVTPMGTESEDWV